MNTSGSWVHRALIEYLLHLNSVPQGGGNSGTLFKVTPKGIFSVELTPSNGQWTEEVLYSFSDSGQDGAFPGGTPVRDKSGNGSGTTSQGGTQNSGVVFEVTP